MATSESSQELTQKMLTQKNEATLLRFPDKIYVMGDFAYSNPFIFFAISLNFS